MGSQFGAVVGGIRTLGPKGESWDDRNTNWDSLYGGLDDLDQRLDSKQKKAFEALDRVSPDKSEIRARAINQAFVGNWVKNANAGIASTNWPAIKAQFAKDVLGVDLKDPSDKHLYDLIAQGLKEDREAEAIKPENLSKAWAAGDWKNRLGLMKSYLVGKPGGEKFKKNAADFWASINKPFYDLPRAPDNLPDVAMPGSMVSPAVVGGVYNGAVKPLVEGFETPLGVATLGIGSRLHALGKTYPIARKALAGISGLFAASMTAATVEGSVEARGVLLNPNATLQDKIEAVSKPVGTGLMGLLAAYGTYETLVPKERATAVADRLTGKSVAQSAEILRQEAVTESPEAANALNRVAAQLDELGKYEQPGAPKGVSDMPGQPIEESAPAETAPRQVGEERIAAAAIRKPDGTIAEGYSHDTIKAELAEVPTIAKNDDGTFKVTSPDGTVELDGVTESEAKTAAREMTGGADQPTTVAKVGEALAGAGAQEGFVTNTGRFVGRDEAARIAAEAGQLRAEETTESTGETTAPKPPETPKQLHSHQVEFDPTPEFPRSSFGQTSLKNAYDELERVAYNFHDAPPSERVKMAESYARAKEISRNDRKAGERLAEMIKNNPEMHVTPDQWALLLDYKTELSNDLNHAADIAADANQTPELRYEAQRQVGELSDKLVSLMDARRVRISHSARDLRWQQTVMREDYSFATQETLLRAAKGGAELTDSEREGLQTKIKALEQAQAKYEARIAQLTSESHTASADRAVKELSKPPRQPRQFRTAEKIRERLHTEADEAKKRLLAKLAQVNDVTQTIIDSPAVLRDTAIIGADKLYSLGLDFAKWSAEMAADLGPKIQPALARIWEESKKLFHEENRRGLIEEVKGMDADERSKALGPIARELARAKIDQGMKGRAAIVDAVHSDLKEAIPDISRREAMDAISGYGEYKPLTHDQITDQLRDLKGQLQQVAKLEDMAAGQAPKKTGVERRVPSDEERALIKQVEEAKKEGGYNVSDPERQLKTALDARKTRLTNQIADLEKQIETRTKIVRERKGVAYDDEANRLKARRDELKKEFEMIFGRKELTPLQRLNIWKANAIRRIIELKDRLLKKDYEPRPRKPIVMDREAEKLRQTVEALKQDLWIEREKAKEARQSETIKKLRTAQGVARGGALSGYHVLAKLAAYDAGKFAEAPVLESVSRVLRELPGVKTVAKRATAVAGNEYRGLAKFYAKAATTGVIDALETARTGRNPLKVEMGDFRENVRPIHWYDFLGIAHMVIKSPLLRAAFEMHLEKLTQDAISRGVDVNDQFVAAAMRAEAYGYAEYAILQEKNAVADAFNGALRTLERDDPKAKEPVLQRYILSTAVKVFLTKDIHKVPLNYIAQTFERSPLGLVRGTGETIYYNLKGVDALTPEQVNAIYRRVVVGSVGTAMFLWGYFDAGHKPEDRIFGGYYQPGEKRGEKDVGWGRIKVGSHELPHFLTHNPMTEVAQMGSTFRRVQEAFLAANKRKGSKAETQAMAAVTAFTAASVSTAYGSLTQAPVVGPIQRITEDVARRKPQQAIFDDVASLIPMISSDLARDLDSDRSRMPTNFVETIEAQIPGLRQNVPETKTQKARDIKERLKKRQEEKK